MGPACPSSHWLPFLPASALATPLVLLALPHPPPLSLQRMLDMFRRHGDPPEFNHLYALPAAATLGVYAAGQLTGAPGPGGLEHWSRGRKQVQQ